MTRRSWRCFGWRSARATAAASTSASAAKGPSDHPDLADWLVDQGIQSISLNPDTVVETWLRLATRTDAGSGVLADLAPA